MQPLLQEWVNIYWDPLTNKYLIAIRPINQHLSNRV